MYVHMRRANRAVHSPHNYGAVILRVNGKEPQVDSFIRHQRIDAFVNMTEKKGRRRKEALIES